MIGANEVIETEWDPAEVHDLSAGGLFDYQVSGYFLVAAPNSTVITDSIPYNSTVSTEVNGKTASETHQGYQKKMKRSTMGTSCDAKQQKQLRAAEKTCNKLALKAASVAKKKNSQTQQYMIEYFDSADSTTRTEVEQVLRKAATECSTTGTNAEINCEFKGMKNPRCNGNIYAYTMVNPSFKRIAYCPEYFSELKPQTKICHETDQATTTLHEVTHVPAIKGTADHAYGYQEATRLKTKAALTNADSYALFANGEYLFVQTLLVKVLRFYSY